ncbi:hypothetical protein RHMOL_Rhmol06G0326900 [Rhododendron molle]|uniref:Uncharacterized protein n=1 Tax=Rhododendron molle TaxID=49168 RepID=A0ACC0NJP9_RHOML|nr:hypothetical protein RHMOL_Rhmol06G0326900 [Rhododendron molle]
MILDEKLTSYVMAVPKSHIGVSSIPFLVTGVDSSVPALELARENVILNELDPGGISFLRRDAADYMKDAFSRNETWDLVIVDPPKLAPRRKVKWIICAVDFFKLWCFSLDFFGNALIASLGTATTAAASSVGRKVTIIRQAGAACDHPIDLSYPEGAYLSNILLRVL